MRHFALKLFILHRALRPSHHRQWLPLQIMLTLFRPGRWMPPPPLSFFGNYSETVQFSILKFSDFSQIRVSDIFGLIHFFVSFSVLAVEGHFFAYISEIWPKNGDFQNFWKIFKPFSAEINMLTLNLWNYNKNWKKKIFDIFSVPKDHF